MAGLERQNDVIDEQLIYESIESFKEYLPKLIQGIEKILEQFTAQSERDAFALLVQVIDGIQWTFEVVMLTKPTLERMGIIFDEAQILAIFHELTNAVENHDIVLITDLLEYEILEILRQWEKNITMKSN